MLVDPRFGLNGGAEPAVCAFSGQTIPGRHSNKFAIPGTNVYYAVLAKYIEGWTTEKHEALCAEYHAANKPAVSKPILKTKDE